MKKVYTKGNVVVNEIEVGDIHYEFEYNVHVVSEVITKPERDDDGMWSWKSKKINDGSIINYGVNEKYSHYGPNLYDYVAYEGTKEI